jgi:putative tryptophan/tyrosine transport system substrate-binding protein
MKRREFITILGGAAAWPLTARAQQAGKLPAIGYLGNGSADANPELLQGFFKGLAEVRYIPDRNVTIEYRWANGDYNQLLTLAAELVADRVIVIVTFAGFPTALAAKAATTTTPIIFMIGGDPIAGGLVASLSHPGGNLTGITATASEIGPKRLEILRQLVPNADAIAVLVNPNNRTAMASTRDKNLRSAAEVLGLELKYLNATSAGEIEAAFAEISKQRIRALFVVPDPYFINQSKLFAKLSNQYALPTSTEMLDFPRLGGLMSYGMDFQDMNRLAGIYAGQILKGAKPTDLPVQEATKFELIINRKAAKALGLEIPDKLLATADEVIE